MQNGVEEVRQIMVLFSVPLLFLCAVLIGIHLYETKVFASLATPRALSEAFDRDSAYARAVGGSNVASALGAVREVGQSGDELTPVEAADADQSDAGTEVSLPSDDTTVEDVSFVPPEDPIIPPTPVGSLLSLGEMDLLLSIHNRERARLGVAPLSWSVTLEASAQAWADLLAGEQCAIAHSDSGFGENIFYSKRTGYDQTPRTPQEVMDAFMDEAAFYDRTTHTCREGEICGHYTQIMWSGTTALGCARSLCLDEGREEVWVCHYAPAGNVDGQVPF